MSVKSKIQSLISAANAKTGESDATLTDAVQTLVDGYGQGGATVDDLVRGAWPTGDITLSVVPTRQFALSRCPSIRKVTATYNSGGNTGANLFVQSSITEFVAHSNLSIGMSMFLECTNLTKVTAPKSNFYDYQAFRGCANLEVADLGTGAINRGSVFFGCKKLNTLILRSTSLRALGSVDNFSQSPFRGGTGVTGTGTLYVPASLVDAYKTATNWSTLYSNGTMDVQPIEGSIYETQYADGTPIT